MKLLLDTHAFIWLDGDPARLSGKTRAACADPANELHLSLASIWELQVKLQLGKLTLRGDLSSILSEQQRNNHLRLLATRVALPKTADGTHASARRAGGRDPTFFTRLAWALNIISQAMRPRRPWQSAV